MFCGNLPLRGREKGIASLRLGLAVFLLEGSKGLDAKFAKGAKFRKVKLEQ